MKERIDTGRYIHSLEEQVKVLKQYNRELKAKLQTYRGKIMQLNGHVIHLKNILYKDSLRIVIDNK